MDDVVKAYIDLRNDGYLWNDTKVANLGRDESGILYVLDYGEIRNINNLDYHHRQIEINKHANIKRDFDDLYNRGIYNYPKPKESFIKKLIRKKN